MKNNLTVGQKLYYRQGFRGDKEIKEVTVSKIGNKYFYVEGYLSRDKFHIETLKSEHKDYSQFNVQLYLDKQDILDEDEKVNLKSQIQRYFSHYPDNKFTLDQLRKIAEILGLNKE